MNGIFGVIIIVAMLGYAVYTNKHNKDRALVYGIFVTVICLVFIMSLFMSSQSGTELNKIFGLTLVLGTFYLMNKSKKMNKDKMKIDATQISYWGVPVEIIKEKYKHRIVEKKGRKEVEIENAEYFTKIDKKGKVALQNLKFIDVKNYNKFIKIKNIDFFTSKECSKLYKKLYSKLIEIDEENETDFDFNEILKENSYILEFFLIDLWERLASHEPLGVATLNAIAHGDRELDLLGALDSAKNSNVGSLGFELFMHYENFKKRMKGYL